MKAFVGRRLVKYRAPPMWTASHFGGSMAASVHSVKDFQAAQQVPPG